MISSIFIFSWKLVVAVFSSNLHTKKVNLQIILKELKYNEHLQSFSSLSCFLAFFSSFLQTITGAQTDHYARQADMISLYLSPLLSYLYKDAAHSPTASSPREWKRKCRGDWSVKSPLSPPSLSDRSDTTADNNNNNNKDSDKRRCRIIHEGWRTQPQRSSVSTKLTHSAPCVFSKPSRSWVTTPNLHPPRRHFPLNGAHLVWERKAPNEGFKYQSAYSPTWLKSLQFVTSGALLQNKTTLCDTWAHTKRLLKRRAPVGDTLHIHNEEINKLCPKSLFTLEKFQNNTFPQKKRKQHFINPSLCFYEKEGMTHYFWSLKDNCECLIVKMYLNGLLLLSLCCTGYLFVEKGFRVLLTGP